jgi:hypothetical protein
MSQVVAADELPDWALTRKLNASGAGLVLGYALLGAAWMVLTCSAAAHCRHCHCRPADRGPPAARRHAVRHGVLLVASAFLRLGVSFWPYNGAQKVAVAAGFTHPVWPTKIVTAKIVVLGLE